MQTRLIQSKIDTFENIESLKKKFFVKKEAELALSF